MKSPWSRLHSSKKGFTLVELLIVVAIIGVLAAMIIPNVTGIIGSGETEAAAAEKAMVQVAMDTMMAKNRLTSVTATGATSNMSLFPTGNPLYPNYLRTETTKGTYSCSTTGLIQQDDDGY